MLPQEWLRRMRQGEPLTVAEIAAFGRGLAEPGLVSDAQAAAFAMAVCWRGLLPPQRVALTLAMADSGARLDWRPLGLPGPVLDKHSAGGVGDKVTLILVPLIAACGGFMPKLSGPGLGHTGGTLDKVATIPGYQTRPDLPTLQRVVAECGGAIVGAGRDLAPADRRLYAIRDVTGTTESIDLITASILSKKLAAGAQALVLDVTLGSGALVGDLGAARDLADSLVSVATDAGLPTVAMITDMNQIRGHSAGNALEVREAIEALRGGAFDPGLRTVVMALGVELLILGGLADNQGAAIRQLERALDAGLAAERFGRMVTALGGPADLLEQPERHLATAPVQIPVWPERAGYVRAIEVRRLGMAVVQLGGGRRHAGDAIDPAVGLSAVAGVGEPVGPSARPLAVVHAQSMGAAEAAAAVLRSAIQVGNMAPDPAPPVIARIATI